ncbi:10243_t:CDS:2 [Funneliformis geosporum]|nr:10243_t:CDS:2 [Funneliformis geosporum]
MDDSGIEMKECEGCYCQMFASNSNNVMGAEVEEVAMAKLVKALIKAKKKNFPLLKNKDCIENKLFRMLEI